MESPLSFCAVCGFILLDSTMVKRYNSNGRPYAIYNRKYCSMFDSKKYAEVCEDAVKRIYARELRNRGSEKEAEKATKAKLHQLTGAFMTPKETEKALSCLHRFQNGEEGALREALLTHSSTRERIEGMQEMYARVFSVCGRPNRILDLACGINPIYLGSLGLCVSGWDVGGSQVRVINEWARVLSWDVRANVCDLVQGMPNDTGDLTLMMKLLPVLETQEKGAGERLLRQAKGNILVTFPTRTLSGRNVGMEKQYSEWFEGILGEESKILDKFTVTGELCYVIYR